MKSGGKYNILVARKLLGASFSLVRMCAGKPLA